MSEYIRRHSLSFETTVALWQGQTSTDPRPNKAINVAALGRLLTDYPLRDHVLQAATWGVDHEFRTSWDVNEGCEVKNHTSALALRNPLYSSIGAGQAARAYLVVDEDILRTWGGFHVSPFGCVPKGDADPRQEARVIHDLSHPSGKSTNDRTDRLQLPLVHYKPVAELARRIEFLAQSKPAADIYIMKGDVKSAFKNVHASPRVSRYFAGKLPETRAAVIDLALPFGWTGSPAEYSAFGAAISHLVHRESPQSLQPDDDDHDPFFGYEWVDDHVLIEIKTGQRLDLAETALRLAMVAVLGPRAINESKFTSWSTHCKVLGLLWDTTRRTVSIPVNKIQKARDCVGGILADSSATKTRLRQVLGTLRHVCSCIPPARAFYQRLHCFECNIRGHARVRLPRGARLDLLWFDYILAHGRLSGIPTSMFVGQAAPLAHLYMDASAQVLCVLHLSTKHYIRVKFDEEERRLIAASEHENGFSINVREQLSAAFAVLMWGSSWSNLDDAHPIIVRCWLDNSSAVSWCNRLSSPNKYAQELNRVIGTCEAGFQGSEEKKIGFITLQKLFSTILIVATSSNIVRIVMTASNFYW